MRTQAADHPRVIQGGMGVGVSGWQLARAVSQAGQLGVVSGIALDQVYARQLQLGDPGGHVRRAFASFPRQHVVERALARYFVEGGKPADRPFVALPMRAVQMAPEVLELLILANFAEVFLAKEGHSGQVGINYLYKIQMPLLASLYGAMLGGVDYVLVGAGSPAPVPEILTRLARHDDVTLDLHVFYASADQRFSSELSPRALMGNDPPPVKRPQMLAIVSSVDLATALASGPAEPPDGFVIEGPTAGGHNAPPRGPRSLDAQGQPIYGPRDEVDLEAFRRLGRPFWLAGSYGSAAQLKRALEIGAVGIQVGTAFALCRESGLDPQLKARLLEEVRSGGLCVFTDPRASPSGFPFKVVQLAGTLGDSAVFAARPKMCDVGELRMPYVTPQGGLGYSCPAESEKVYQLKGGRPQNTEGRMCLCNGLLATIGLGQHRSSGYDEPPLVTGGDALSDVARFMPQGETTYSAADVLESILGVRPETVDAHE